MQFLSGAVSASPVTALWRCCWVTWNTFSPDRISEPSLHTAQLPALPPPAPSTWPKRHAWVLESKITLSPSPVFSINRGTLLLKETCAHLTANKRIFDARLGIVSLCPFLLCLSIYILGKRWDFSGIIPSSWSFQMSSCSERRLIR